MTVVLTAATARDTLEREAQRITLSVSEAAAIPDQVVPDSMRAPPPTFQDWADEYIFNPTARHSSRLQAAMPFYLSEELSPRFSRAKQQSGWTQRRQVEAETREKAVQKALDDWEAGGRDRGIEELVSSDWVGLDGVHIRPRTRAEIREAAAMAFDEEIRLGKRQMAHAAAKGQVYDFENHVWVEGEKGEKLEAKRSRKARKQRKVLQKLEGLTLADAKNQVVPSDVRR